MEKDSAKAKIKIDKTIQRTGVGFVKTKDQMVGAYKKLHKGFSTLCKSLTEMGANVFAAGTDIGITPKSKTNFPLCKDKNSPSSLLTQACKTEIANQTLRMELLESLRSTSAFQNAAIALRGKIDLTDRMFSALYPGGGSHVAPVVMAMFYMDENLIDSATFTYTEIDEVKLEQFEYILRNMSSISPSLKYNEKDKKTNTCDDTADGTETTLTIFYNGRPIHFRFLLSCSGESYFQPVELCDNKVFISHDTFGGDVYDDVGIMEEYIQAAKVLNFKQKLPPIVMEDLSQSSKFSGPGPYVRFLDLEFVGKVTSVKGAFGHREMVVQPLRDLSPEQLKNLEDLRLYGDVETFEIEDLRKWKIAGAVPERQGQDQLSQERELGYPFYLGAVILEMNPAMLVMDKEQRTLIFETQIIASGNRGDLRKGYDGDRFRLPPNHGNGLFNCYALLRISNRASELIYAVRAVNPAYEQIFAYRLAQSMMQLRGYILEAMDRDPGARESLISTAQSLYKYLTLSQQTGLRAFVAQINELSADRLIFMANNKKYKEWKNKNPSSIFFDDEQSKLFYKNHGGYKKFDSAMGKSIRDLEGAVAESLRGRNLKQRG